MKLTLFALFITAFAIGTAEFVVAGLLPEIAVDLEVAIPTAGLLITAYAMGVAADGDSTIKTTVIDVVRNFDWPGHEFTGRALKNQFVTSWHGRESALANSATNAGENERYWKAFFSGDVDNTGVFVGEAAGLIGEVLSAKHIIGEMVAQAERIMN